MRELLTAVFLLAGAAFMLLAALGIVRMPDLFTRMQPATKAATLGVGCMLTAVAISFGTPDVSARALAAIGFVVLTAPVAAHVIGHAAYLRGERLWEKTVKDELQQAMREKGGLDPTLPARERPEEVAEGERDPTASTLR